MILQTILTIFIILTLVFFRWCWLKPRQEMKFYENQLKSLKYKVKIQPYRLFYNGAFQPLIRGKKIGDPYKIYKQEYKQYGVVLSNFLNRPFIELVHIDFIKDFYSVDKHYDYPKIQKIMMPFKRLVGEGIGFSQGQLWKKKKSILNNVMNFDFLKSQIPNILKVCDAAFENLQKHCEKQKDGNQTYIQCYMLDELMIKIFSQVILTSFFGVTEKHYIEGEEACQFLNKIAIDLMTHQVQSIAPFFGDWFLDMEFRKIDKSINRREKVLKEWALKIVRERIKIIEKQIEQKGTQIQIDDIIKAMLVYKKQHKLDDNDPLVSVDEIYSHFVGFFLGGTDTTSNYTNMMLIYLAKYPEIQQKVRQEIAEFMKNDDYSFENLKNFKYIDALQKETTRVYGPANILLLREVAKDNYINGLAIKKGTLVAVVPYANHLSEEYFKNPLQFRPERWLNGQCDNLSPFVLIGFSAGARTCLGKHFALLQNKIALIKILKRYKKIIIPNPDFKMTMKFLQCPEQFKTKLVFQE